MYPSTLVHEGKSYPIVESKGKLFSVDFDGCLCVHKYPQIGEPNTEFIKMLIDHRKKGGRVILWTCRGGDDLKKAVDWSKEQGLEFDAVNEDVPEVKNSDYGKVKSIKPYADVYFDDRAVQMIAGGEDQVTHFLKTYLPK